MFDKTAKSFVRELIIDLHKYENIKMDDIYDSKLDKTVIDLLISEMLQSKYAVVDLDKHGEVIVKRHVGSKELDKVHEASNAVLIYSTNKDIFNNNKLRDGKITLQDHQLYFFGRFEDIIFRTSALESYEIKDDIITFKTMNSIYKFKKIKKINIDKSNFLSKENIEEMRKIKNALIESGAFWI